jgi:hypothetical protein
MYIIALAAFLLFFTVNGSALTQFTSSFAGEGAVPIKDSTGLFLIGMGLFGLAGVSRSKSKK